MQEEILIWEKPTMVMESIDDTELSFDFFRCS
jgi:hypothetical protein